MIRLTVEASPNIDYIGEYVFHQNLIYVGNNIDADLYLDDPGLSANHLFIEIVDGQLLAHLGKEGDSFLVNGKRASAFKFLTATNSISIGNSSFRIESFAPTIRESKREVLNKNTEELIRSSSPLLEEIKRLQKLL